MITITFLGFKLSNNKQELEKGLKFFIDTTRATHNKKNKNFVYVLKLFHKEKNDFCFSISYILNTADYNLVHPNYFIDFSDEIVLIETDSIKDKQIISGFNFKKITDKDKERVLNKLYPSEDGGWTYSAYIYTYYHDNKGKIKTEFFPK